MDYLIIPGVTPSDQAEGVAIMAAIAILSEAAVTVFLSGDKDAFGTLIRVMAHVKARDIELGLKYSPRIQLEA